MTNKVRENFDGDAVGRLVQGDPWTASDKDANGNLRVIKTGPNAGQPRPEFFIAVAFPKLTPNPQTGVMEENPQFARFNAILDRAARAAWPALFPNNGPCVNGNFSWKVRDGDAFDSNGKPNAEKPGFAGHWIVSYSSMFAPKIMRLVGGAFVHESDPSQLKRGYYVRVAGNISGNESAQTPGMFVNFELVQIIQAGEEIAGGMDPSQAFSAPIILPPGVTAAPVAAPGVAAAPGAPTVAPPPVGAVGAVGAVAPPPAPVAAPVAVAPPPAPVAAPAGRVMTAAAGATTYEQYVAAGWSDEMLISSGYMQAPLAPAPIAAPPPATPLSAPIATPSPSNVAPPPHAGFIPAKVMTAAAGGTTYDQYIATGWTDEQLIANGLMLPA